MAVDTHDRADEAPPPVIAGLLLAAAVHLRRLGLPHPAGDQVLERTGAGRTRAFEFRQAILEGLTVRKRGPGRPRKAAAAPPPAATFAIQQEVLRFVMEHPGCVDAGLERRSYSDRFRCFLIDLRARHPAIDLPAFATAAQIPEGTLEGWLRRELPESKPTPLGPAAAEGDASIDDALVAAWGRWDGDLTSFAKYARDELHRPEGRTAIATILAEHGVRLPRHRPGRSPDEVALRGSFETFFGGAQWVGDGTPISVTINGQTIDLNVELNVDAFSAAIVGASVRDEEDGLAVTEALKDGETTTGAPPLSLLLDNRPSNHAPEVVASADGVLLTRATPSRPQNKAHVEGAFGLFAQTAPPLVIRAGSAGELARQVVELVLTTWARTLNHRPRRARAGQSRVELYENSRPNATQLAEARAALVERQRRQELARQTHRARLDPLKSMILDAAFEELELADPLGNIRRGIATYSLDAVLAGIATFKTKRMNGRLPPGVDGRYLLGIVRNIELKDEGVEIAAELLRARAAARDRLIVSLEADLDSMLVPGKEPRSALLTMVDRAMAADRFVERVFWLEAAGRTIREAAAERRDKLLSATTHRIHAIYRSPPHDRLQAVRILLASCVALDRAPSLPSRLAGT